MAEPAHKRMIVADFLEFDDGTDHRYELIHGEIVAMAPPLDAHGTVVMNIGAAVHARLRPGCRVIAEAGIVPEGRDDTYYQADLAVTCAPPRPGGRWIESPVMVVEVTSPSTGPAEGYRKLPDYRATSSIREILRVSIERRQIEHWRRTEIGWHVVDVVGEGTIELTTVDAQLSLAEIYRGVALEAETPATSAVISTG